MSDVIMTNKLELASELAHRMLTIVWDDKPENIYIGGEYGGLRYEENAQDIFNDYYDMFLTIIEDTRYDK